MGRKKDRRGRPPDPPTPPDPPERVWPKLNSKHRATLEAVFESPKRGDIPWRDIEGLFTALGGAVTSGSGSRRRVLLGERRATFHEPHPEKVTDKGAIESVRALLLRAGVRS